MATTNPRPIMTTPPRLLLFVACVCLAGALAGAPSAPAPASVPAAEPSIKIHQDAAIQFPVVLLRDGISHGEARVLLDVDAEGHLTDTLVLAYTHRPFADAALTAIRRWRFEPARFNGEPVGTVVDCSIVFSVDGILFHQRNGSPVYEKREPFEEKFVYRPQELIALDRIPTPQHVEPPIYPQEWADKGMRGKVTIDFYIDETGAVRMPSGVSSPYPLLDAAANAAIRQWRFAPPLLKGRPVLAHCEQVFTFERAANAP